MFKKDAIVLIVDDSSGMCSYISEILEILGFSNILQAEGAEQAWNCLKSEEVDIVLCDQNMPDLKGTELLKKVRADEHIADIPFMIISVEGEKKFVDEVFQAGASGFLEKPINEHNLRELLAEEKSILADWPRE